MTIKIDKADKIFSLYIRTRDKWICQRCKKKYEDGSQGLHNSHFHGRAKESTRFDPLNCDAICYGCHAYFHGHPAEYYEWKKKQLGEKEFDLLTLRANSYKKKDRELDYIIYKQMYENLKKKGNTTNATN